MGIRDWWHGHRELEMGMQARDWSLPDRIRGHMADSDERKSLRAEGQWIRGKAERDVEAARELITRSMARLDSDPDARMWQRALEDTMEKLDDAAKVGGSLPGSLRHTLDFLAREERTVDTADHMEHDGEQAGMTNDRETLGKDGPAQRVADEAREVDTAQERADLGDRVQDMTREELGKRAEDLDHDIMEAEAAGSELGRFDCLGAESEPAPEQEVEHDLGMEM